MNGEREVKPMYSLTEEAILFYANEPVFFVEDIIQAKPDDTQKSILRSVAHEPMTSVRSGHGIGKSALESWTLIWFLCTRPFPKIPCTAPTQHQLFDILWAEASKWIRNSERLANDLIWTREKIYMKGHPEEWFAVARTATIPDALQGFHAEHLLYILDEASGIKDIVYEPVLGATSTEGAKLLMCGNPTRLYGFFYDSHHKHRDQYNAIHVDGRNSARVGADFVKRIIDMFGEDSDVFRVRVAGLFPKGTPDSLISMDDCLQAAKLNLTPEKVSLIDIGIDVARYGDDSTVLLPMLNKTKAETAEKHYHNRTTEVSGRAVVMIKAYAARYPDAIIRVKVDCDGLGVGAYDNLYDLKDQIIDEVWQERCRTEGLDTDNPADYQSCQAIPRLDLEIIECHFGGAGGKVDSDDPIEYSNSTGIMWGTIRKALKEGTLQLPDDDELFLQLSNRKYRISKEGKIEMERKEAMKKRGVKSPDIADALALAIYEPQDWSLNW
ncbi:MAG: terminase [Lachnospiraceae bacterium]